MADQKRLALEVDAQAILAREKWANYRRLRGGFDVSIEQAQFRWNAAQCGFQSDLVVPSAVIWAARAQAGRERTVTVQHEGGDVRIQLPSEKAIAAFSQEDIGKESGNVLPADRLRSELARLIEEVLMPHGVETPNFPKGLAIGAPGSGPLHDRIWSMFEPWYRQFLAAFPREPPDKKAVIANTVRRFGAVLKTFIASERHILADERRLRPPSQTGVTAHWAGRDPDASEYSIHCMELEINLILELLDPYHWEYDVLLREGEKADNFLPAEPDGRGGGGGGRERMEVLPLLSTVAFGNLRVVPLDHRWLRHPQYQYYIQRGCKLVVIDPQGKNLCFFFQRSDNTMIVSVEPTPKRRSHAAAYFFLCGKPGDPPEVLKRWLRDVALPRPEVRSKRTEVAPTLIEIVDHYTKVEEVDGRRVNVETWPPIVERLMQPD